MTHKPTTAVEYEDSHVRLVRATCLYLATKLGDLADDLVVIGGLVPSLLIPEESLPDETAPHVGTMDLDVGMTVALLEEGRYRAITERLRAAGFSQDSNGDGNPTRQRWKFECGEKVTVDFLIPPTSPGDRGGNLQNIEADFAAIITPGLHLAFKDRRKIVIDGETIVGERAVRDVWVCGPGAYVVLKAMAFKYRGENKDAYDLYYVVRNFGASVKDVASCLRPLLDDAVTQDALIVLQRDFLDSNGIGARRVAEFVMGEPHEDIQADVVGFVGDFLRALDVPEVHRTTRE